MRGKHLHLDCSSGLAGDMFLGALLDLGVSEAAIREGLGQLGLGGYRLLVGRKLHHGLSGCDVRVELEEPAPPSGPTGTVAPPHHHPGAGHQQPHRHPAQGQERQAEPGAPGHPHRSYASIRALIQAAPLAEPVKARALDIFARVARAEARLHGRSIEEVSFHEVGAIDSIVDIVGAALALEQLQPLRVTSRPVPLGHGFTRCAHGVLPVPAPAAVSILAEVSAAVEDGGVAAELCTPTGAAIIAHCVQEFRQIPSGRLLASGFGAGDRELPDRPNLLRALLFEAEPADSAEQQAVVIEANIDDMPAEFSSYLLERLFAAGARDVWFTPIVMKKGRPAITVSALCPLERQEAVGTMLLVESTSIGYRYLTVGRRTLSRATLEVSTSFGPVLVKLARDGERVLNVAPEFEVVRALAQRAGVSWKEVYAAALAAYRGLADSAGPG